MNGVRCGGSATSTGATVRALIDELARRTPERVFLIAPESGRQLTFAGLHDASVRLSQFLGRHGLRKGDIVALLLPNGLQTMRLLLGTMHGGFVVAPLNLLAQPSQLAYVLDHSDARLVFTDAERSPALREIAGRIGRAIAIVEVDVDAEEFLPSPTDSSPIPSPPATPEPLPGAASDRSPRADSVASPADTSNGLARRDDLAEAPHAVDAGDTALLMYTSGTTGKPKGVVLTHANLVAGGRNVTQAQGLTPEDRVLAVLPLYHINGQVVTGVAPLVHGGSVVLPHRFSPLYWELAALWKVTWLNVVPTVISYLLSGPDPRRSAPGRDLSRIRFCRCASAPLPPAQHRAFEQKFGIGVIETMGLTETAAPVFSNPLDPARRKLGSPGMPVGVEARIVDPVTGTEQPRNVQGEIVVRGDCVMRGYYKAPEETARALSADGWLRTGDLGRLDDDGFVFVTGRLKELISKGGEKIAPREIDEALLRHPAVLEAAAASIPDEHYGQEILACVVVKPGWTCSESELRAHCLVELGSYKTPRVIRFVGELPKGPSGKVQRLKLTAA